MSKFFDQVVACERCGSPMHGIATFELTLCGFCINAVHELEDDEVDNSIYNQGYISVPIPSTDGYPGAFARTGKAPDTKVVQPNTPFGKRLRNHRN